MRNQTALNLRGCTGGMSPHTWKEALKARAGKRGIDFDIPLKKALNKTAQIRRCHLYAVKTTEIHRMHKLLDLTALGTINRAYKHTIGPEIEERRISKVRGKRFYDLSTQALDLALF